MPVAKATNGIISGSRNFPTWEKCNQNALNLTQGQLPQADKSSSDAIEPRPQGAVHAKEHE